MTFPVGGELSHIDARTNSNGHVEWQILCNQTQPDSFADIFTHSEQLTITTVSVAVAGISLVLALVIVATYHGLFGCQMLECHGRSHGYTSLSIHVVYWVSLCHCVLSLTTIADGLLTDAKTRLVDCNEAGFHRVVVCEIFGAFRQFFALAATLWTGALAVDVQRNALRRGAAAEDPLSQMMQLHFVIWGLSGVVLVVVGELHVFGNAGQWCWIRSGEWWAWFAFLYVPRMLVLAYLVWICFLFSRDHSMAQRRQYRAFRAYVCIFLIVVAASLSNRLQNVLTPGRPQFGLFLLQSSLGQLQPVANALVLLQDVDVKELYARLIQRVCLRCCGLNGLPVLTSEMNMSGVGSSVISSSAASSRNTLGRDL